MTADRPGLTHTGEASPGSCLGATPDNRTKLEKRIAASRKASRVRKRMLAAGVTDRIPPRRLELLAFIHATHLRHQRGVTIEEMRIFLGHRFHGSVLLMVKPLIESGAVERTHSGWHDVFTPTVSRVEASTEAA